MDVVSRDAADRLVGAPVDIGVGIAARRVERSKRVGKGLAVVLSVGCGDERRGEERRRGAGVGGAIRRVGGEHADRERIDRGVEIAKAGADAGRSRRAQNLARGTAGLGLRRPGQADARREAQVADGGERVRNSGIAGIEDARRRAGKDHRLRAGDEGGDLVVFFRPGRDAVPAQAVVQRQVRARVPAILREEANIFVARIEGVELALVVLAGHADEEVGKIDAGFRVRRRQSCR